MSPSVGLDLSGELRVEIREDMAMTRGSGELRLVNTLRFYGRSGRRWKTLHAGPIIQVDDNRSPTRAELLHAAARIVAAYDGGPR